MLKFFYYTRLKIIIKIPSGTNTNKTEQPKTLPTFRWRPDLVSGIPILCEILAFAPEIPKARFHENERPGIPLLRLMFFLPIFFIVYIQKTHTYKI
jgi:hypothetical protein